MFLKWLILTDYPVINIEVTISFFKIVLHFCKQQFFNKKSDLEYHPTHFSLLKNT